MNYADILSGEFKKLKFQELVYVIAPTNNPGKALTYSEAWGISLERLKFWNGKFGQNLVGPKWLNKYWLGD